MAEDLDKNLAATPYKLEQARKRGSVAKSPDVVAVIALVAALLLLMSQGERMLTLLYSKCGVLLQRAFDAGPQIGNAGGSVPWLISCFLDILLPALGVIAIGAVIGNVIQTGLLITFEPIKPNWERLNPAQSFKKLFSLRSAFDGFRTFLKLIVLGVVLYYSLKDQIPVFFRLSQMDMYGYLSVVIGSLASLGFKMALALAVLAAIDWLYTNREFAKQMRMSHKEQKDEHKQREGDPRIKAKLRALRNEFLAKTLALRNVGKADVVITNPTHLALALRYEHGMMESPQLLAKGAGSMALAIRRIAALHRIPVVENKPLARRLFRSMELGSYVDPSLYGEVAKIIVWVLAMRRNRGAAA